MFVTSTSFGSKTVLIKWGCLFFSFEERFAGFVSCSTTETVKQAGFAFPLFLSPRQDSESYNLNCFLPSAYS